MTLKTVRRASGSRAKILLRDRIGRWARRYSIHGGGCSTEISSEEATTCACPEVRRCSVEAFWRRFRSPCRLKLDSAQSEPVANKSPFQFRNMRRLISTVIRVVMYIVRNNYGGHAAKPTVLENNPSKPLLIRTDDNENMDFCIRNQEIVNPCAWHEPRVKATRGRHLFVFRCLSPPRLREFCASHREKVVAVSLVVFLRRSSCNFGVSFWLRSDARARASPSGWLDSPGKLSIWCLLAR